MMVCEVCFCSILTPIHRFVESFINHPIHRNVRDVELEGVPPPCVQQCFCCAKSQEHVRVNLSEPKNGCELLRLKKGEGQDVSRKIKNQVEVMQVMERS